MDRGSGSATKSRARRRANQKKRSAVDVVYTPPKPFNRNRFLLRLATVGAIVLALLFGMAIFFKVKTVTVTGMEKYTAWDVREASQIRDGENLLTISQAKVSGKIKTKLPYVQSVRVRLQLPDTVKIEIQELDVVYSIQAEDGTWWLITADGNAVEQTASGDGYTKVEGVKITQPTVGAGVQAYEIPPETTEEGETVPVTIPESEKLRTAISILRGLESQGLIGQITGVNVSDGGNLEMWYGDRYQVMLGDATRLDYKISAMKNAVAQMKDYESGVLDVSFTAWPDQVGYTPFP